MLPLADIEPRTVINAINTPENEEALFVISRPGSYYLAGNVTVPAGKVGIVIDADEVTLDLGGFAMLGETDPAILGGIRCGDGGRRGITVRNGTIGRAGAYAIDLAHDGGRQSRVRDVVTSQSDVGIRVGPGSLVSDCDVLEAGEPGLEAGDESIISRCRVHRYDAAPRGIKVGSSAIISECSTIGPYATGIEGGESLNAHDCLLDSETDVAMIAGAGGMITDCIARGCRGDGIRLESESLARGNHIQMIGAVGGVAGVCATGWRNVITDGEVTALSVGGKAALDLEGALNMAVRHAFHADVELPLLAASGNAWSIIAGAFSAFSGNTGGVELASDNPDANIRH
jgi:hypothetical protein